MISTKPICVLGVMTTQKGLQIANEMTEWISPIYDVQTVFHKGTQFELPALQYAKAVAVREGLPVLYLHTRGAVNTYETTVPTRKMWREEFGEQYLKYQALASCGQAAVFAPFVDWGGITRYNGFIATAEAWDKVELKPSDDRHYYERIWRDTDVAVIGTLIHSQERAIEKIRKFLMTNYK